MVNKELLQSAKEKIGVNAADIMADVLSLEQYDTKNKKALCCWHTEKTPSLIFDQKRLRFHCFSCGKSVDILDSFIEGKHMTFNEAATKVFELADMEVPMPEVGLKANKSYRYPKLTEGADMTPVYEYLGKRGISKAVVDYAGLSCDGKGNIEFPFYDSNDVLKTVKLRPARKIDKSKGDIKTWSQKDKDHENVLFLQNLANPESALVLTEGEIDCLAVIQAGYKNVVSIPFGASNTKFIDEQWDFFEQFDNIVVCGDNDEAGRKFNKEVVARLGNFRTRAVELPSVCIDDKGTKIKIKDINECLYYLGKDAVLEAINKAIEQPIPTVVDFSNVKEYNLDEVDGVTFGIKELDKGLMRLYDSSVTVVYAKPSAGKTSLMNQLISETMNDGKPVFLYSQELSNALQSNWILFSLAGRQNINTFISKEDTPYYRVTPSARKEILNYYKNMLFLYRDGESIEIDDILKTAEMCVRRQGCKLVVLDNLTCISCKGCESDLHRQTEIVRKTVQFAITFSVPVVLVSHSRKTHDSLGIDDVTGSMNIANLSSRMLSMERNVDGGVTVKLVKDRYLGKNGMTFNLNFDYPSRRFFTTEDELNKVFAWDKGECLAENPPVSIALEQMRQKQGAEQEVFGA